jgi:myo-inositol catabolism protein IolH
VHQHLKIGDGDIDWDEFSSGLADIGFYDRPDVSRYQLATITNYVAKYAERA